jgi:hypothetical protein
VKLNTHLHLLPSSREVELYLNSSICIYGVVLSYFIRGTNFGPIYLSTSVQKLIKYLCLRDIKRILNLTIYFIRLLYNLLQHFTNRCLSGHWCLLITLQLQRNYQLFLASRYIALDWTTEKTPLPSNGRPLLLRIRCRGKCLLSHCLAMGPCVTI